MRRVTLFVIAHRGESSYSLDTNIMKQGKFTMKKIIIGAVLLGSSFSATAVETAVGLTAGLFGAGAEVTFGFNENISVRGLFTNIEVDQDIDADDADYKATIELGGYGVIFDYHPFGGKFRLSSGLLSNNTEVRGKATANQPIQIGDNPNNQLIGGEVDMVLDAGGTVPYIGIGWGSAASEGFPIGFGVDLGVIPMSPEVDVNIIGGNSAVILAQGNQVLDQEEAKIQDDLNEFELFPVLQFKASYRF